MDLEAPSFLRIVSGEARQLRAAGRSGGNEFERHAYESMLEVCFGVVEMYFLSGFRLVVLSSRTACSVKRAALHTIWVDL